MKLWDKIASTIINILIVIIAIITLFTLYSFIMLEVMDKDYVKVLGYTYFEVASGSMSPSIKTNDIVIVKVGDNYEKGDIITYISNEDFVTHRVIEVDNNDVTTKGDANNTKDKPISKNNVIGRVKYILPQAGIWKNVFMTPKVLISIVITLILFSFTLSYNNKTKRIKLKKQRERREKQKNNSISSIDVPTMDKEKKNV